MDSHKNEVENFLHLWKLYPFPHTRLLEFFLPLFFGTFLLFLFLFFFSLFFYAPSLYSRMKCMDFWNINEEKFFKLASMRWLHHGWKIFREWWSYWRWMHNPEWIYAHQYFWVRLANKFSRRSNHFKKFQNSRRTHSLTNINNNKSCYVDIIWLWLGTYLYWGTFVEISTPRKSHTQGLANPILKG